MKPHLRPLLVFALMSVLVAQTLTRFLDAGPGGVTPGAVRGINAFLDFVLVSRIGVAPSAAVLALLTIVFTALAYRRQGREKVPVVPAAPQERIAKAVRPRGQAPKTKAQPATTADSQVVNNMIEGMISQLAHDRSVMGARGHEPVVVRLVPQVPLRDVEHPRRWLCGAPAMADDIAWPEIDGRSAYFLAQICCADLPADLWDGLGPRDGWLAFFIHPTHYRMRVLHVMELGPWRQGPDISDEDAWLPSRALTRPPLTMTLAWPRWPVDLVAVWPGQPDPRREGRSEVRHDMHKQGYDLVSPEHHPFDRSSTLEMLELAEARVTERLAMADQPTSAAPRKGGHGAR